MIAVWPSEYVPAGGSHSFGQMMASYPNYIHMVNVAYDVTSDMYQGYVPFGGDTQKSRNWS